MQKKNETFSKSVEFKALIEKETDKKVNTVRSDIRGEYVQKIFNNFFVKDKTQRELETLHNPL